MAVLKDLIVHGPSKFIGKTQFNTINARSIGAKEGIFDKLIATTLKAETATIDDLTAENATVVGLLDVQGELHTNAWTNANIANIGGSFYISPSVETVSGKITINKNTSNWTVQITGSFATDFIKTAGATTASAWPADSLVLVTGNVVVNNMDYPLGTLKGKLTAQVAASAASTSKTISMTCASDYVDNPNADVLQMLYEANGNANITQAEFSNGKISMYKISGTKPIGILLSSVGITAKGSNYIDIYGGTNNDGTPNLRIGHLTGLGEMTFPNNKKVTPVGWGLYADNAYLSGTIHSAAGIIGGFTIDSNSLHNGTFGTANSVLVSTGTSSAANIAGSGSISGWAFTAGTTYGVTKAGALYATSGSIAGWNFNGTSLYKTNATPGYSAATMVISTGTKSTKNIGGGGTDEKTWMLSAGTGFGVTTAGKLYAKEAVISGLIQATSGFIGQDASNGWNITTKGIYNGTNSKTSTAVGTYIGQDAIRCYNSSTQYVHIESGKITAFGAVIKGALTATSLSTGTKTASTTGKGTYIASDGAIYSGNGSTNNFKVTATGDLTAVNADISGTITATSGSFDSVTATNFKLSSGSIANSVTIGGTAASTVVSNASTAKSKSDCITIIDTSGIWVTPTGSKPTNTLTGAGATGTRINSDGMQVYVGGSRVASYGTDAIIGIDSSSYSNIKIEQNAITMYNRGVASYTVQNLDTRKIHIIKDLYFELNWFSLGDDYVTLKIPLNNTASTWEAASSSTPGIVMQYRIDGELQTAKKYQGPTVNDTSDKYYFKTSINSAKTEITAIFGPGQSIGDKSISFESIEFNFTGTNPVIQNIVGPNANTTLSGPFRTSKGTATSSSKKNGALIDFDGNIRIAGDIFVHCNDNSEGGISLGTLRDDCTYTGPAPAGFTGENGYLMVEVYQVGMLVSLTIRARKTTSTAAGSNFFLIDLATSHIPVPAGYGLQGVASGFGYASGYSLGFWMGYNENEGAFILTGRNLASTTAPAMGVSATITYIWNGTGYTNSDEYL